MKVIRVMSFGGGVQSNAVLVLQAAGKLPAPYDVFVFANVGNDSENPDTLSYVETVTKPYARANGIEFIELVKRRRNGDRETLLMAIMGDNRSVPIPAYMSGGAPGNRSCTQDFKIRVVDRYIRTQEAAAATIGLGISIDEFQRMRTGPPTDMDGEKKLGFMKALEYPLISLRLNRLDCMNIIARAGLDVPPKSSCFFCPFHSRHAWQEIKREQPEQFEMAVQIEERINAKRESFGKDRLYLHSSLKPLAEAVGDQMTLYGPEDACETGYCMT